MRGASFLVVVGVLGCATGGQSAGSTAPAAAPTAKAPAPAKNEVVVIGRGPQKMALPGEVSIAPKDQGTDFVMHNRRMYRCTKLNPPPRDPENSQYCRAVQNGDSRNPDPGRMERSKTQSTWH